MLENFIEKHEMTKNGEMPIMDVQYHKNRVKIFDAQNDVVSILVIISQAYDSEITFKSKLLSLCDVQIS